MAEANTEPTMMFPRHRGLRLFILSLFGALLLGIVAVSIRTSMRPPRADPKNGELVTLGRQVYQAHCAQCHGANLEGQPNWKERRPDGSRPAPPHDASGHTWHHPDTVLFEIVQQGTQKYALPGEKMTMPAFDSVLSDKEIAAVIAYIKSTWPPNIQQLQEEVNQQSQNDQ
jgi:S-disulfanyl-L-cysteine oxidoreductase SoxD